MSFMWEYIYLRAKIYTLLTYIKSIRKYKGLFIYMASGRSNEVRYVSLKIKSIAFTKKYINV